MELSGALFKSKLEKITPPPPLSHQKKKKSLYSWKWNFLAQILRNFLYVIKENFSYISGNGNPAKFLYFRKQLYELEKEKKTYS